MVINKPAGCSGSNEAVGISANSNAHAEEPAESNYGEGICLDSVNDNDAECRYVSGSCASDETCIVSLSSATNAHVGGCNDYTNKVCCKESCNAFRYCGPVSETTATPCVDQPSDCSICGNSDYCVYNSVCYADSFVGNIDADSEKETCSLGHWCPEKFKWDPGTSKCIIDSETCQPSVACYNNPLQANCINNPSSGWACCKYTEFGGVFYSTSTKVTIY